MLVQLSGQDALSLQGLQLQGSPYVNAPVDAGARVSLDLSVPARAFVLIFEPDALPADLDLYAVTAGETFATAATAHLVTVPGVRGYAYSSDVPLEVVDLVGGGGFTLAAVRVTAEPFTPGGSPPVPEPPGSLLLGLGLLAVGLLRLTALGRA